MSSIVGSGTTAVSLLQFNPDNGFDVKGELTEHNVLNIEGEGDDIIIGGAKFDLIRGGAGDDVITGLAGDDILEGGAGCDIIRGGDGDDVIRGGMDADILIGGNGNDVFIIKSDEISTEGDHNIDNIRDFEKGDVLKVSGMSGGSGSFNPNTGEVNIDGQTVAYVEGEDGLNLNSLQLVKVDADTWELF